MEINTTILCVEDEYYLRRDIVEELTAAGYGAVGAVDGVEALATLENVRPQLILCDISMPRLDGYGFLEAVRRQHTDLVQVPFIFLTALDQRDQIINGKRCGADDYLVKPIDYDLMLATIEAHLRQVNRIERKESAELKALRLVLADKATGGSTAMRSVLDILPFGIVVMSPSGVVFANRCAQDIHHAQDGLSIDSMLYAGAPLLAGAVKSLLTGAYDATRQGQDYLSSLPVSRPSGRRDFILTACALSCTPDTVTDEAQAVVFISDPERRPVMSSHVLRELFNLTPTEAEVARALTQGWRTTEIAQQLSIAPTTVTFHLRNLFEKTGTHRQADLIVLLLTSLTSIGDTQMATAVDG